MRLRTEKTIKSAAEDAAQRLHNGVDAAEERIEESVDAIGARIAALEKLWRDHGEDLLASAQKQMRAYPLAAFGIAFVAGIAAARMLRR